MMPERVEVDLLPCPFCGGDNVQAAVAKDSSSFVISHVCKFQGVLATRMLAAPDLAKAVAAWNQRVGYNA